MAFQTRGRDPLLDSTMAEAIEKRGKELLGLALLGLGIIKGGHMFRTADFFKLWIVVFNFEFF